MASEEFPEVIELSVGETHKFTTPLSTLTKHKGSRLADMFTGRADIHKDIDGRYCLNVDGFTFSAIMDFLENDQLPSLNFEGNEIQALHKSTLSLGLKEFAKHLENRFPWLVNENNHIVGSANTESKCVGELAAGLRIGEPAEPNQQDGTVLGGPISTITQKTPSGSSQYPRKSAFESSTPQEPAAFRLKPAAEFSQPSSREQETNIACEKERIAIPEQRQISKHFGNPAEITSTLRNVQNPAFGPSVPFGTSANGDSEMLTWTTVRPSEVQKDSNEQKSSDGEGLPTKKFEGFTGYR